ncbi:MAG: hypothetical protein ACYC9L_09745 [Sulfuricaulis sp.]
MKNNKLRLYNNMLYEVMLAALDYRLVLADADTSADSATGGIAYSGETSDLGVPGPVSYRPQLLGVQYSFIRQHQYPLHSPYRGLNSLEPNGDTQDSNRIGFYNGWAFMDRLQGYLDIEKYYGTGVSGVPCLGGSANGDVVCESRASLHKDFYVARANLRYMELLSGEPAQVARSQEHISSQKAATHLEFKLGKMAANDDFDLNCYANSTHAQFLNWPLATRVTTKTAARRSSWHFRCMRNINKDVQRVR